MFRCQSSVVGRYSKPSQLVCAVAWSVSLSQASCVDQKRHYTDASDSF